MVSMYYRLYITYTLMEFLFELDQSNICKDIEKIEGLIRCCLPIPQKIYNITEVKDHRRGGTIFPRLYGIYRLYGTADTQT